jgi:outer membrane protein OmpA-like peptidoglycan-associated protein
MGVGLQRRGRGIVAGLCSAAIVCAGPLSVGLAHAAVPTDYPPKPPAIQSPGSNVSGNPNPQPVEPTKFEAQGVIVIDGVQAPVLIKSESTTGVYRITGRGIDIFLTSVGPAGKTLPLAADGSLLVLPGGTLEVTGKGFAPTSSIVLWLLSTPIRLVARATSAKGEIRVRVHIPEGVAPGEHHAQAFGYTPGGQELRATLPIHVLARPLEAHRRQLGETIHFDALDATVARGEKQALDRLIADIPPGTRKVRVTVAGYVQPSTTTANDLALSTARARMVARYLRSHGVRGAYIVTGRGVASAPGAQGRQSQVRIVLTVLK